MAICLNKNSKAVQNLISEVGEEQAKAMVGAVSNDLTPLKEVNGVLVPDEVYMSLKERYGDSITAWDEYLKTYENKTSVKDGVNMVFNENPEVAKIGNQQQYSKYLDTIQYQNNTNQSTEEYVASEKTIRDLAERIADRIGLKVRYESDRTKDYKGKLEGNTAVINLAYATLDTPIHEILGHPIVRAIKNRSLNQEDSSFNKLYENLLEELSTTQKGKEVLDRVKRDYQLKSKPEIIEMESMMSGEYTYEVAGKEFNNKEDAVKYQQGQTKYYTLEEQQEEAIVELVSLMAAGKIEKTQQTNNLLGLLKQLWIEMSNFIKSLLSKKEVDISKDLDNIQKLSEDKLIEFMKKGLIKEDCK